MSCARCSRSLALRQAAGAKPQAASRRAGHFSAQCSRPVGTAVASRTSHRQPPTNPATLVVAARVVTMNDVAGRLDSVRRRGGFARGDRHAGGSRRIAPPRNRPGIRRFAERHRPAPIRLALMTSGTDFDPAALVAGIGPRGFAGRAVGIGLPDRRRPTSWPPKWRKPDTLGVLLTPHAAAGLCLANRLPGVRADRAASTRRRSPRRRAAVGANLLVVDPRAGTFFQLKQMITEFCRGGVRPCPEVFRETIGIGATSHANRRRDRNGHAQSRPSEPGRARASSWSRR